MAANPTGPSGAITSRLTHRVGPLPVWGWAVVIGGGLGGILWLRSRGKGATGAAVVPTYAPAQPDGGTGYSLPPALAPIATPSPPGPVTPPQTPPATVTVPGGTLPTVTVPATTLLPGGNAPQATSPDDTAANWARSLVPRSAALHPILPGTPEAADVIRASQPTFDPFHYTGSDPSLIAYHAFLVARGLATP
ncbi:MAG: hypothetical protein KGK07_13530 [Chloroflexota bacterium]|nr:hypothetical protein [Chloroflexota bacterium]